MMKHARVCLYVCACVCVYVCVRVCVCVCVASVRGTVVAKAVIMCAMGDIRPAERRLWVGLVRKIV